MSSESAASRNWLAIAAVIAVVAEAGLVAVLVVGDDVADPDPTPIAQVLREIRDDGTWVAPEVRRKIGISPSHGHPVDGELDHGGDDLFFAGHLDQ
jgi:hypothetical protein